MHSSVCVHMHVEAWSLCQVFLGCFPLFYDIGSLLEPRAHQVARLDDQWVRVKGLICLVSVVMDYRSMLPHLVQATRETNFRYSCFYDRPSTYWTILTLPYTMLCSKYIFFVKLVINVVVRSLEIKNRSILGPNNPTARYRVTVIKSVCERHIYVTYLLQQYKISQGINSKPPQDKDRENVGHRHSGILLSHKNEILSLQQHGWSRIMC